MLWTWAWWDWDAVGVLLSQLASMSTDFNVTAPCRWQSWPRSPRRRRGWTPLPPAIQASRGCWWCWWKWWNFNINILFIKTHKGWVNISIYYHGNSRACLGNNGAHTQGEDELEIYLLFIIFHYVLLTYHHEHSHHITTRSKQCKSIKRDLSEKNHAGDDGNVSPDATHLMCI